MQNSLITSFPTRKRRRSRRSHCTPVHAILLTAALAFAVWHVRQFAIARKAILSLIPLNFEAALVNGGTLTHSDPSSLVPSPADRARNAIERRVHSTLSRPLRHYPTLRKPPCMWHTNQMHGLPMSCMRMHGKVIGFSDKYSAPFQFPYTGLWRVEKLEHCDHVDIWIIHVRMLSSVYLKAAIESLPNTPEFVVVDDSGEIGQMDEANCMFNELIKNRTFHGSSDVAFILSSQATSFGKPGQRMFNQHWGVPRKLSKLEATGKVDSAAADVLDPSAVNITSSRLLCLGGYPRPHKVQFMGELDARGLLDRMLWSGGTPDVWTGARLEEMLKSYKYTDREIGDGLNFRHKLPHVLDVDRGAKKANEFSYRPALYSLAKLHLVLESNDRVPSLDRHSCSRTFRYTEKTLKAMYSGARFILFADPASLELLRSHGFRTFHPHINETYDTIPTYREKADALHLEIERIISMRDEDFGELLLRTQAMADHNRKWLLSPSFANMVYRQSLFAYGLSSDPGFDSSTHARSIDAMYASLNLQCSFIESTS
jgi:hypothetical protein